MRVGTVGAHYKNPVRCTCRASSKTGAASMCFICDALSPRCGWQGGLSADDYFWIHSCKPISLPDALYSKFCEELGVNEPNTNDFSCQTGDSCLTHQARQSADDEAPAQTCARAQVSGPPIPRDVSTCVSTLFLRFTYETYYNVVTTFAVMLYVETTL